MQSSPTEKAVIFPVEEFKFKPDSGSCRIIQERLLKIKAGAAVRAANAADLAAIMPSAG